MSITTTTSGPCTARDTKPHVSTGPTWGIEAFLWIAYFSLASPMGAFFFFSAFFDARKSRFLNNAYLLMG